MTILALDTSSLAASCALWRDGVLLGEFFANVGHTHSETAMPMVRSLLAVTGVSIEAVDLFAASVGPGSFTGLRIGVASVKGLAMGKSSSRKLCAPVSTLESLAENCAAFTGIIAPVMDARREQVYTALFRCESGKLHRLSEDSAAPVSEVRERIAALGGPVMLAGDGAGLCKAAMADLGYVRLAPPALLHQRAGSVAEVAARLDPSLYQTAGELAPAYLRLPQAERERLARLDNRK